MANAITYSRMFFLIPIALFIMSGKSTVALVLFVVAALTDWLDGFVARKTGTVTETGKVMDQIADKVLVTGVMVFLVAKGDLPAWLVATIVWRDSVVSGVRILAAKTGRIVAANVFGKIKTVSQMILIILILAEEIITLEILESIFIWIVFFAAVISALVYITQNRKALTI